MTLQSSATPVQQQFAIAAKSAGAFPEDCQGSAISRACP